MKRALSVLALAALPTLAQGAPAGRFLVLSTSKQVNVRSGDVCLNEQKITVPPGASLTLLELGKGKRWVINGPSTVQVGARTLSLTTGKAVEKSTEHASYAQPGTNDRRPAGIRVRSALEVSRPTLKLLALGSEAEPMVRMEYTGPTAARPSVISLYGFKQYYPVQPVMGTRLVSHASYPSTEESPANGVNDGFKGLGECTGKTENGRWVFEGKADASWLDGQPIAALQVLAKPDRSELLVAHIHFLTAREAQLVSTAQRETEAWAREEPHSAEPWLTLAYTLRQYNDLLGASRALRRAEQLRPHDSGILGIHRTVLQELGDFDGADAL